ncbi:hypothetical protein WICPIJ_008689 [Wickerhamomyces pijperi]|uniref:Uncharacterized protein n=1 Tax=Wickerhamomyces pijperi TaxID=599730 RepID=A0A9P8THV9_WICPI|nr:hypothetical protein WICPIJ_008689 [Wickerhamomyces pijperi]
MFTRSLSLDLLQFEVVDVFTKHFGNFFQGSTRRLDKRQVNNEQLHGQNTAVDNVVLPFNGVHGNRIHETVVDLHHLLHGKTQVDTLGSDGERQDLGQQHGGDRGQENGSSLGVVEGKQVDNNGNTIVENHQTTVEHQLLRGRCDTNGVQNLGEIVRNQPVTRQLHQDTNPSGDEDSLSVTRGLEQGQVREVLSDSFVFNSQFDLRHFEINQPSTVSFVVTTVVLHQHRSSFFVTVFGDQESWGFRNKVNQKQL